MASGSQVKNGKAFEFAIAKTYAAYLREWFKRHSR